MKLPLTWIQEYVDTGSRSAREIADALTQTGLEVEDVSAGDILSVRIPSNRGDCISVLGVARELSAIFNVPLKEKQFGFEEMADAIETYVSVDVASAELCPRYSARLVFDVKIAPSPAWVQEKLAACGVKSINNVVDITNLVCLEFGQPMHAFDFETLQGRKIIVRAARAGEKLLTLDHEELTLDENSLVIADSNVPVALAGVLGGEPTGVTEKTRAILLESANFSQSAVRIASKKYAVQTESSYRFERGVDAEGTLRALDAACGLILQTGSGNAAKGVVDVCGPEIKKVKKILFREERYNKYLGTSFTKKEISGFLTRLHFKTKDAKTGIEVAVPSYRRDIQQEVELIEEVARLYGYNNIPETLPKAPVLSGQKNKEVAFEHLLRETCLLLGLNETRTHSLVSAELVKKCFMSTKNLISVRNPVSEDANLLRGSLLPSLLDVAARCAAHQETNLYIFEIGKVYGKDANGALTETLSLAGLMTGTPLVNSWNAKEDSRNDFYYFKGTLELFLSRLGIKNITMKNEKTFSFHPYNSGEIYHGNKLLGYMGEIHPQAAQNFGITKKVYMFELDDATRLTSPDALKKSYAPLPRFPSVTRDIAFFIDKTILHERVEDILQRSGGTLLENVSLFDVYEGKPVPDEMKSLAYALTFRHPERTLKSEEADVIIAGIKESLKKAGASLRE